MFFELLLPTAGSNVAIVFPTLVKNSLNSSAIAKGFEITSPLEFISLEGGELLRFLLQINSLTVSQAFFEFPLCSFKTE